MVSKGLTKPKAGKTTGKNGTVVIKQRALKPPLLLRQVHTHVTWMRGDQNTASLLSRGLHS